MCAESLHHVLKYVYMKGNVNKRLDSIIHLIMRYARDEAFNRLMKVEKRKLTKHTRTITIGMKQVLLIPLVHHLLSALQTIYDMYLFSGYFCWDNTKSISWNRIITLSLYSEPIP